MKRKLFVTFVLVMAFILFAGACQRKLPPEKSIPKSESETANEIHDPDTGEKIGEAPQIDLTVTEEEAAQGWQVHTDIGFKYKLPSNWLEFQDSLDQYNSGDPEDKESSLSNGVFFDFMEASLIRRAREIMDDQSLSQEEKYGKLSSEVWSKSLTIFGVQLYKREAFDKLEKLEDLTSFTHNRVLATGDNLVHVVSWADKEDGKNLSTLDREIFNQLIGEVDALVGSIQVARPVSIDEIFGKIKKWTFNTLDLNGKEVDETVLGKAKLTMVNIWATWCGACEHEIPDISDLANTEFVDKNVQVLGIVVDVEVGTDNEDGADTAKQMLSNANASYLNVMVNRENMYESLIKHVKAYPTTIFMDSSGNVVGSIIEGMRTKEEFLAAAEERLKMLDE